jgi:hypothetical protein
MCEIPENAKCVNLELGFYYTHRSDQILSDIVGSLQMLLIKQKYILQPIVTRVIVSIRLPRASIILFWQFCASSLLKHVTLHFTSPQMNPM